MKISSASKKVLASALSAAMVVAFAPTVAFGAIANNTTVTVKYDVNGGTIADSHITSIPSDSVVVDNNRITLSSDYGKLTDGDTSKLTKNGFSFKGWFFDANGDGEYNSKKDDVLVSNNALDVSGDAISGTEVTLKAAYNEPVLNATLNASSITGSMEVAALALTATGLDSTTQYTAKLAFPNGVTVVNAQTAVTAKEGAASFTFSLSAEQIKAMTAGDYVFSVSDATHGVIATEEVSLVTVKLSNGAGYGHFSSTDTTEFVVTAGDNNVAFDRLAKPAVAQSGYAFHGYTDGKDVYTTSTITVKRDTTLTAVYNNPQVTSVALDKAHYTGADKGKATLTFSAANLVATGETGKYVATVTGPDGFSKSFDVASTYSTDAASVTNATLKFGEDWEGAAQVATKLAAGEYTVSLSLVAKQGQELTAEQKAQKVDTKSISLAAVTYDLGAGQWAENKTTGQRTQPKTMPTLIEVGTGLKNIFTSSLLDEDDVDANDELQGFDYYTVNGKKVSALGDRDTAAASGVTVAVNYKTQYIAAPGVSFAVNATDATKYDMTVTAASGTKAYYKLGTIEAAQVSDVESWSVMPDNGVLTLLSTDSAVSVKAVTTDTNATESKVVTYKNAATTVGSLSTFATAITDAATSTSATNAPVRYGDTLTTLKADAVAVATAKGYATTEDWEELKVSTERDMLTKAIAIETENLTALKTPKLSADGKTYTYVTEADAAAVTAALEQVLTDFDGLNGKNASKYTAKSTEDGTTSVTNDGSSYIEAITYAVKSARTTTVSAADYDAAAAVTKALKAATDEATAKAAIEAYNGLTEAQKEFVKSADVEAACQIVFTAKDATIAQKDADAAKAAEEAAQAALEYAQKIAEEQDHAAVNLFAGMGKTVTAKAKAGKKAQGKKFSYKLAASESGNTATFTKTGSSKIKVSAAGKVTFAKVKAAKKAKTYKAKVTATIGTQTQTVTVKYVVKKK